ncbi:MAG: NADH:flavin oxidoreductase [Pirellulaceae bacterium]|nr:NADH:flavin oxidoreductase [Pirellulaceae bacterium]
MNETIQRQGKDDDRIFQPLTFRSGLVVKNRLFRSNVSGRFDHYDGHGSDARIKWETSFAEGGVGCIISSFTPVSVRGRILVNYAMIDDDDKIPFWRRIGKYVHEAGTRAFPNDPVQSGSCKYIMQLSHSGRQRDGGGVENVFNRAQSSTNRNDYFHGILCEAMTKSEIHEVVQQFAEGARRAQEAGLDGVELHGANGYLITQYLSSAINDRSDEYGGTLRNRARFVLEIIDAIKQKTHGELHVQLKTNAADFDNALYPWRKPGNTLNDALQVCGWAIDAGADAIHVSSGSIFPHPRNPPGDFPVADAINWYDIMLSSGVNTRFNYKIFTNRWLGPLFRLWWNYRRGVAYQDIKQGVNLEFAAAMRRELPKEIPVIVTGGFQHRGVINDALRAGKVDGVSIARPLIANRDLPKLFYQEMDWADASWMPADKWPLRHRKPCSYCNKCLFNDLENPLGCYDQTRYPTYDVMIDEIMEVFKDLEQYQSACTGTPPGPSSPQAPVDLKPLESQEGDHAA